MEFFPTLGGRFFCISKNLMDQFSVGQFSSGRFFRGRFFRGRYY